MKVDRGKCSRACSREPACSHCFPKCVSRVPATIRAARYVGSEIMENVCLSVFFHIFPRWTEKDPQALAEASCFPDVKENIRPFVENQLNWVRSEEHTSELQELMRNSYAVFCFK